MDQSTFSFELDRIRSEAFELAQTRLMRAQTLPNPLYHYTDEANLEPILQSRMMRATEGRFLNDKTELRHAGQLIEKCLDADMPAMLGPVGILQDFNWLLKPVVNALRENALDPERPNMFISSFTRHADRLSQWTRYANNGNGVALGFDLDRLRADGPPVDVGLTEAVVGPCTYDPELQNWAIETALKPVVMFAVSQSAAFTGNRIELIRSLATNVLLLSALLGGVLKHPGFDDEGEWRILVLAATKVVPAAVKYRPHRYSSLDRASYIELPFDRTGPLALKRAVIGPCVNAASEAGIRTALIRHGFDIEVVRSEIPYLG